jgi:pSer/pThr/pTyr-binding forkhead associated (FHA) protein
VTLSPLGPHQATPGELKARADVERRGATFLVYRDGDQQQVLLELDGKPRITIGRRPDTDVPLGWDSGVSRTHAELERIGRDWVLVDDGLSQNGSYVNEVRVIGRRRLADGDVLRFGRTAIGFRSPRATELSVTVAASDVQAAANIPPAQRRVLVELCRPLLETPPARLPASNRQIAERLYLSLDGVKTHLRALSRAFGVDELPQNEKRMALAERALGIGAVTARDVES